MPAKIMKITQIEYKKMPKFLITYGISETPFGKCLMALHSNTLCYAQIFDTAEPPMDKFKKFWSKADLVRDDKKISAVSKKLFLNDTDADNFPVTFKGTSFQMEVWEALMNVKRGSTVSYEGLAVKMGRPSSTRAVANAVANNNIVYFVPCHRVISKSGALHKFGCGVHKKFLMLKHEDALPKSAQGMF